MHSVAEQTKYRVAQRESRRPFASISWLFALLGFAALIFLNWMIGGILILVAILIDRKRHHCGACGNRVEQTSTLCPTCGTYLQTRVRTSMRPPGRRQR